ncbi:MAG TPA: LamG domain-containing protein, partial [Planctomycetota bacterium]|nr:LamG domain-containing protein [Planctomycetota bacterium]
ARIGALFPLLEGEPVDLSSLPPGALAPRIVSYGARVVEERTRPDVVMKEGDARARFLAAERQFADAATRLQSFETFRALLSSFADCTVVRRKRSLIAQRLEAEKDAGKEYVLYADQMQAAGAFRRVAQPKAASCWTSSADVPPEKENFVEFTFAAKAATEYRCWIYVGGCCTETFAFEVQGTELGADPGSANRLPVKNSILFLKKTHAQHGGRKEPTRFEWVAIPLPKYASPGAKTVRLLSGQQGFSVAYAVVSAVRTAAPSDVQVKEWERSRPAVATTAAAATSAADSGLVAWWTLDEGAGSTAADSSPNHFSGTLRGNPVWTSGKRRGALSFDGQKDYVEIPKAPKLYLPGPLTVAAWVNVATLPRSEWGMYLFSDYSSDGGRSTFALRVMGTGSAQFLWQTEDAEPPVAASSGRLTPGIWAHLAGVWDGTARMLYVNGVLDGTAKGPQARPDIGGNVSIGRPGAYNGLYFSGRIDDVRIYNRALSTAEIRSLVGR